MSEPIVIPPGEGEIIGDSPDRRVEMLSDRDELHATWSRFGPGREGADLHIHHRHTDLFYVLEGELTVRLGAQDQQAVVPAGTVAQVPPLVVHGFRNASDADVKYLNFHAPGEGFADFMRGLRDGTGVDFDQDEPPADGARPKSEAVVGGGELIVDEPGRREVLLADVEAIGILEATLEAGASSPAPQIRRHVESLYVLEGQIALAFSDRELRAEAGSWVQVPSGVAQTLVVEASEPTRYLSIHTPSDGFGRTT